MLLLSFLNSVLERTSVIIIGGVLVMIWFIILPEIRESRKRNNNATEDTLTHNQKKGKTKNEEEQH